MIKKILNNFSTFIDKNPIIAAGNILPALLVPLFIFIGFIVGWFQPPASKYDPLFTIEDSICNSSDPDIQFSVWNGILKVKVIPNGEGSINCHRRKKIYRFSRLSRNSDEIITNLYNDYGENKVELNQSFELKATKGLKIVSSDVSPDLYSFTVKRGDINNEQEHDQIQIQKNGKLVNISPLGGRTKYRDREIKLLGWINSEVEIKND